MATITVAAHFDGRHIQLDEPIELQPNARLLVTVVPEQEDERTAWGRFAAQGLAAAYDDDETEYSPDAIKERNPDYKGV